MMLIKYIFWDVIGVPNGCLMRFNILLAIEHDFFLCSLLLSLWGCYVMQT